MSGKNSTRKDWIGKDFMGKNLIGMIIIWGDGYFALNEGVTRQYIKFWPKEEDFL